MFTDGISLFSGAGGDTIGLTNSGVNVIGYSEYIDTFIETHKANHPKCKLIGKDIRQIKNETFEEYKNKIGILFAGFPCFIKGTKVLTDEGYKNIENVRGNELLLTHTGKFQKITNLQRKIYKGKLYHIKAKYHPSPVICTEEHPFYVRERDIWKRKNGKIYKSQMKNQKAKWIKAKDLTEKHLLGMPINNNEIVPTLTFEKKINKFTTKDIKITLDNKDYWFMMGYFVGDGWIEETLKKDGRCMNKIRFSINNDDEEYVLDRIRDILPITDKKCSTGKCKKFGCADFFWFNIFKQFGKYAHGKLIPEWVQDAPKHLIQEFINGYIKADGCIHKNNCHQILTVSYNLAFGLQRLLLKLGIITSINKSKRPSTCTIEGRIVNQRDTYHIRYYPESKRQYTSFIENNYAWFSIFNIEIQETKPINVYNFEVENDNSYIVENIVCHNCQTFSHGGKKEALSDPRGNLFYDFVRAADVMKPRWVIGENVKGILSRKNEDKSKFVKDIICEEFEKIGYHMYEPFVLKASDFGVPQKRERCFFVGSLKKHDFTSSWFEQHKAKEVGLKDIVGFSLERALLIQKHDELDDTYENLRDQRLAANKELKKKLPKHRKIIKIILNYTYPLCAEIETLIKDMNDTSEPTESPPTMLKKCFKKKDKHGLSFRTRSSGTFSEIVDIELPTKTILCTYGRMARLYVPICNKIGIYLRPFTIPELLQIQDFPSDYDLKGGYLQQVTQIGNAVPPKLVEIVMKQIKELDNFESIKTIKPIITNEKETYTNDDLQKLIIAQLKDICRKHKEWKRWSKLKKQELIEFIIKNNKN